MNEWTQPVISATLTVGRLYYSSDFMSIFYCFIEMHNIKSGYLECKQPQHINDLHSAKILCNWSAWTTRRVPSWPPTVALIRYKEIQRYTEIWIIGGLCHWPSKTTTWLLVNHTLCQRDIKTLPVAAINEWMKYSGKRILLSKEDRDLPWWFGNRYDIGVVDSVMR